MSVCLGKLESKISVYVNAVLTWGICRMINVDVALRISIANMANSDACRSPFQLESRLIMVVVYLAVSISSV